MQGTDHQRVVIGRAPRHRGVKVGEVAAVEADGVRVRLAAPATATATAAHGAPERDGGVAVKPGDGVVFDAAHRRSPEEREEGGPVVRAEPAGSGEVRLAFLRGSVDLGRVAPGDWLWRTHDADVAAKARPYLSTAEPLYTRALRLEVGARVGAPLVITGHATGPRGEVSATVAGTAPLVVATRHGLDLEQARRQLGRLGGTPYHLGELNLTTTGEPFVPVSELNRLRRELVERLQAARLDVSARLADGTARNASSGAAAQRPAPGPGGQAPAVAPRTGTARAPGPGARAPNAGGRLHLLVRTPEQLDAVLEAVADRSAALPIASVTLDYLELYGLRPSVERAHEAGIAVRVASPRVLKPTEQNVVRFLLGLGAGILVRSGGLLHDLARLNADERPELHGDFSLNVTNAGSADAYLALGLSGFAPGHDLNGKQVAELAAAVGARPSRSSPTTTCPSSTRSTASSVGSCPTGTTSATAVTRARRTASPCGTRAGASIRSSLTSGAATPSSAARRKWPLSTSPPGGRPASATTAWSSSTRMPRPSWRSRGRSPARLRPPRLATTARRSWRSAWRAPSAPRRKAACTCRARRPPSSSRRSSSTRPASARDRRPRTATG